MEVLKTSSSVLRKTQEASRKSDLHKLRYQWKLLAYCDRWILFLEQLVILTSGLLPLVSEFYSQSAIFYAVLSYDGSIILLTICTTVKEAEEIGICLL